ncbi:AbrB/MazE/SpoVT family DNA-binding domain-containing protein [Candidatus Pacearchaeota archaeon]|nr:AbrB/MazE/SpoVT family DNA-binding domain-containing protein [Candidatus Pacearchaeota archaeon]
MLFKKVQPIGHSIGVIIPSDIAKMLDIEKGDNLKFYVSGKKIVLNKIGDEADDKPTQEKRRKAKGERRK